jgi:hypothetical protein
MRSSMKIYLKTAILYEVFGNSLCSLLPNMYGFKSTGVYFPLASNVGNRIRMHDFVKLEIWQSKNCGSMLCLVVLGKKLVGQR